MYAKFVKAIVAASLIGLLTAQPASAGWGHHGGGFGVVAAAGLLGGLAIGALASQPAHYPAYGGYPPRCYPTRQPVFDAYGNIVGYRPICQ